MMKIRTCTKCVQYTMRKDCPTCGMPTIQAKPAKYSPEDRYGDLRRKAKQEQE